MSFGKIRAPLVSIIVINFNYGRFLDECLMSIVRQTYAFIECIVFDNGSTDVSGDVLQSIVERKDFDRDGRSLSIVRSERNLYQTPAAAEAFKHAKGSFIIFFDADDYMLPTCVETHIRAMLYQRVPVGATCVDYYMSRHDEIVTSTGSAHFSRHVVADDEGHKALCRIVEIPETGIEGSGLDLKLSELHYVERNARGWPWSGTCGLCFRREMIELMFRRVPDLKEQLDSYLIGGVNCLTGAILIDRPLVVYRHHGGNAFAGRPFVNNFHFYDPKMMREASSAAVEEIIKTYVFAAEELARQLDWSGLLLEAVETLSSIWAPLPRKSQTRAYMREFLARNEVALVKAFGAREYAHWVAKYSFKSATLGLQPKALRAFTRSATAFFGKQIRSTEKRVGGKALTSN